MLIYVVIGSPFLVAIGGEPSGRVTERIVRQQEAADITHIGSQCELSLKIPGVMFLLCLFSSLLNYCAKCDDNKFSISAVLFAGLASLNHSTYDVGTLAQSSPSVLLLQNFVCLGRLTQHVNRLF